MGLNKQTYIRTLVPGIIIYIVFLIIQSGDFKSIILTLNETEISISDGWSFILMIILGVIYHLLGLRKVLWIPITKKLQKNVEDKLLLAYGVELENTIIAKIRKDRMIIYQVFYPIINSDENLKVQANFIFYNGAILTSIIDIITILFFTLIYLAIEYFLSNNHFFIHLLTTFFIVIILSIPLLYLSTKRHFKLSNAELDYITNIKKRDLNKYMKKIIKSTLSL